MTNDLETIEDAMPEISEFGCDVSTHPFCYSVWSLLIKLGFGFGLGLGLRLGLYVVPFYLNRSLHNKHARDSLYCSSYDLFDIKQ